MKFAQCDLCGKLAIRTKIAWFFTGHKPHLCPECFAIAKAKLLSGEQNV